MPCFATDGRCLELIARVLRTVEFALWEANYDPDYLRLLRLPLEAKLSKNAQGTWKLV